MTGADNESLRKWAKVKKGQTGIMVTKVDPLSSAKGVIEVSGINETPHDVLLSALVF